MVSLAGCDEVDDESLAFADGETGDTGDEVDARLLGGVAAVKPSVGGALGCTATLVDPRFVLTAGHCIAGTGPLAGWFAYAGESASAALSHGYWLWNPYPVNSGYEKDLAILELGRPVVDTTPIRIAPALPASGTACIKYGRGCQDRQTGLGGGWLQQVPFTWPSSAVNCPGDSGGPVVCNAAIAAVNSGYAGDGSDIHAHAHGAIPILDAARQLGAMKMHNTSAAIFAQWASTPGARAVSGDFDGDGRTDVALMGAPGWTTLPVAWNRAGAPVTWSITNTGVGGFAAAAAASGGTLVGDFDADGRDDIALYGNPGWTTIPIAFSNGDGSFDVTNFAPASGLASLIHQPGAKPVAGDLDADGDADLMITGIAGWTTLPVGLSTGDGTFTLRNEAVGAFAEWAATSARALAGDFNGDGAADVALVGNPSWSTIPVAYSRFDGRFDVVNHSAAAFAAAAGQPGARFAVGDFDGDRDDDIAAAGPEGWTTVPFALSQRGGFAYGNLPLAEFPALAGAAGSLLAGDFNDDRRSDLALTSASGWQTIPLAVSDQRVPTVTLGSIRHDNLTQSDAQHDGRYIDEYYFTANVGSPISVAMVGTVVSPVDPYVRVFDTSNWTLVAYNDDDPSMGLNSRLTFTPVRGRTYVVRASTFGAEDTGSYRVAIAQKVIVRGESFSGQLVGEDGADANRTGRFAEELVLVPTSSDDVTVRLKSGSFDTYLQAFSATTGKLLAFNDDCGGSSDSCVTLSVVSGIPVVLGVSSYHRVSSGGYTVTVE